MKTTRIAGALLALLALALLPLGAQAPKQGGDLRFSTFSDPIYFTPFMSQDSASSDVNFLLFRGLVTYDNSAKIVPQVAESMPTVSADGLTITFKLRKGVKFHNGEELTSEDVKVTYDLIRDPAVNSPRREDYSAVSEILTPDPYTVVFKLSKIDGVILDNFAAGAYLVPAKEIQKYDKTKLKECEFSRKPIGCGPFKFVEWQMSSLVKLERFDDFYAGKVGFEKYLFVNAGNQATGMIQAEKGETHRVMVPESDIARMSAVPSLNVQRYLGPVFDCIVWNTKSAFFEDKRVRQAMSYGINKQAIVSGIYKGNGKVGVSSFIPGTPFYNAKAKQYGYDLARAKALLDEAGWKAGPDGVRVKDGKRFKIFMITNKGNIMREKILQYVQSSMKALGIEVNAQILEWNTFLTKYVEVYKFDAYVGGFSTGLTANHMAFYHSEKAKGFLNRGRYSNPEVDKLLESVKDTVDRAKQAELAFKIQEIVAEEVPYTFIINRVQAYAYSKKVKNVASYDLVGWNDPEICWVE
jgi:peptide/nickel transport system substrate-binding protein